MRITNWNWTKQTKQNKNWSNVTDIGTDLSKFVSWSYRSNSMFVMTPINGNISYIFQMQIFRFHFSLRRSLQQICGQRSSRWEWTTIYVNNIFLLYVVCKTEFKTYCRYTEHLFSHISPKEIQKSIFLFFQNLNNSNKKNVFFKKKCLPREICNFMETFKNPPKILFFFPRKHDKIQILWNTYKNQFNSPLHQRYICTQKLVIVFRS